MTGYTRQAAANIVPGATIASGDLNNEYNALEAAFSGTTGHDHSGGTGLGPTLKPTALSGLSANGIAVRTSTTAFTNRSVAVSGPLVVTNGDGVSGNPTVTNVGSLWGGVNSGTANAIVLTSGLSIATAVTGMIVGFRTGAAANTSAVTIALDSTGTKTLQKNGSACVAGDLAANANYAAVYDGTYWQLSGGSSSGGGAVSLTRLYLFS